MLQTTSTSGEKTNKTADINSDDIANAMTEEAKTPGDAPTVNGDDEPIAQAAQNSPITEADAGPGIAATLL